MNTPPTPAEADAIVDEAIGTRAYHVIGVEADDGDELGLCYTAGLAERGHADLVIATLTADGSGGDILAAAATRALLGNPLGTGRQTIPGRDTERYWVLDVPGARARDLMPLAVARFHRAIPHAARPYRARQIVWAYQGYFPWEEGYDGPEGIQPLYGSPPWPARP
jgi:hypothetical protein